MSDPRIKREAFELAGPDGELLFGDLRTAANGASAPPVIVCHSFMSFKDWGFFPYLAERLAAAGFAAISFNFSRNGVTGDGDRITEFRKFEGNTFSRELSDLGTVLDALESGTLGTVGGKPGGAALLGHSRGGGIAILRAAADSRVRALVTWSAIATFDRWTRHQKEAWRRAGYLPLAKDTAASPLRLGLGLLNDLELHPELLDIEQSASKIRVPWLLVHGAADVTVPPREALRLRAAADQSNLDFRLLDGVGHLYNAATRAEESYRTLDGIIELTIQWLHHHFNIKG